MTLLFDVAQTVLLYPVFYGSTALFGLLVTYVLYNAFFHPLSKIPGPLPVSISPLWLWYHAYDGTEASAIHSLHQRYGPVVRIGPWDVSISDGAALNKIYVERGGFLKPKYYSNFDIDGFPSLFSALDPAHRAPRAKAVVPLFAQSAIRSEGYPRLRHSADLFIERVRSLKQRGSVDILTLARCLALDGLSDYLFAERYGGLDEKDETTMKDKPWLSAAPFVETFVAVGRFFLLPHFIFVLLELTLPRIFPDKAVDDSMAAVDVYCKRIVDQASPDEDTYQARMLRAGVSPEETAAQCKDLMFAGTDSTSTNLATICWHLAQNPETYDRLRKEIHQAGPPESVDPQNLPFLRAVIREGLRIGLANPTRLPRLVPSAGFSSNGQYLPPGTIAGCSSLSMHRDESVFPDPLAFKPERWDEPTDEMNRNWVAFGLGPRACIARNLATVELFIAVQHIIAADLLEDAKAVGEKIHLVEWFNSKVEGDGIQLSWPSNN